MIAGELRTMPMHELREKARLGIAYAAAGTPVMVFTHGDPSAVLIANGEAERWVAIERSLSALHGLDVYPELADDTSSLASVLAGRERPNATRLRCAPVMRRAMWRMWAAASEIVSSAAVSAKRSFRCSVSCGER